MVYLFNPVQSFSLPLKDPVLVFSIVLFIILLAPILLSKLRIPGIVGLILAGVVLGPNGFHVLERNSAMVLFGTVGLLYIMFLAGLELDLDEFKKNKYKSLVFGILTFIIPLGIGIPACYYFLGFNEITSILIASMFATHTLVAYPIASRLGISKSEPVAITVGGTIITDTAVLLILTVITGSTQGSLNNEFWIRLGISLLIFSIIVFVIFPMLARWFFRNLEGEKASQYIFVLALVFLAAFLAQLAGVEPIIGAFMAGLALNRLIPHTSSLMSRIEFVGNAIFIPFFLISVGMLVDLKVLLNGYMALLVAGTLTIAAISGKWIAAFLTQKIFRYSVHQRNIIFGLSSGHAAATLAVILIGFNLGLVDENVLNGTIILILVTCLVSSFVTENSGKILALQKTEIKPESIYSEEKILVSVSKPEAIDRLIDFASMIQSGKSKQSITALSIVANDNEAQSKIMESNKLLEKIAVHASANDTEIEMITRVDLNVASGIINSVQEQASSIIIMGWREKPGAVDRIFGSTLDKVLLHIWKTIMVCRINNPCNLFKRIVLLLPPNAHFESGFPIYAQKTFAISKNIGIPVVAYGQKESLKALEYFKKGCTLLTNEFENWEDFLIISREVNIDDLLMVVSARKGTISNVSFQESIPNKLSRYFNQNSYILIYPEQQVSGHKEGIIHTEDVALL